MRLSGKTALITGGTTGIGFATARLFLKEGARVAIIGQDEGRVREAAAALGHGVLAIRANVASADDMAAAARRVEVQFGGLDVLFVNAGIAKAALFADVSAAHIDEHFDVNVRGAIWTVQKMLPLLRNPASVILTSTTLAAQGAAGASVYAASKAAVASLALSLAAELVGRGVRVNIISPGRIDTPIFAKLGLDPVSAKQLADQTLVKVPIGRFGEPDEIANVALFLASDDSSYLLGVNIHADGGWATL
jgi:NAD(P)-dependent dehydrogenase (short-subunit alcohol dehydrogenase family)